MLIFHANFWVVPENSCTMDRRMGDVLHAKGRDKGFGCQCLSGPISWTNFLVRTLFVIGQNLVASKFFEKSQEIGPEKVQKSFACWSFSWTDFLDFALQHCLTWRAHQTIQIINLHKIESISNLLNSPWCGSCVR